eukprot:scaffold18104_cov114-Isochrysis_galbana.AAC.7
MTDTRSIQQKQRKHARALAPLRLRTSPHGSITLSSEVWASTLLLLLGMLSLLPHALPAESIRLVEISAVNVQLRHDAGVVHQLLKPLKADGKVARLRPRVIAREDKFASFGDCSALLLDQAPAHVGWEPPG